MIVVTDDTERCPNCGVPIWRCGSCGLIPDDPGQRRCARCTDWLPSLPDDAQPASTKPSKKMSTTTKILIGVAVLVVLAIFATTDRPDSDQGIGVSTDNLPIVDGPFKDCLLRHGYGPADDLDQLEVNEAALDACE